jgi:hypothetical protein
MENGREKEIDLLLHEHARHGSSAPDASISAGTHLDADELIAYAENALPPQARTKYSEHLAECGSCRAILIDLAADVTPQAEESVPIVTGPTPSVIDRVLAALRMPALRYGIPFAAVLLIVSAVLLTSLKTGRKNLVAKQEVSSPAPAESNRQLSENAASDPVASSTVSQDETVAAASPEKEQASQKDARLASPVSNAPENQAVSSSAPADNLSAAANVGEKSKTESSDEVVRVSPTGSDRPEAIASQQPTRTVPSQSNETQLSVDDKAAAPSASGDVSSKMSKSDSAGFGMTAGSRAAAPMSARRKAAEARERDSGAGGATITTAEPKSAETRAIGNKEFRRVGGSWVDTAYNSSQGAFDVKRGSEQYRALLADEPGLRQYAEGFNGSVVVVWKGRSYRFH